MVAALCGIYSLRIGTFILARGLLVFETSLLIIYLTQFIFSVGMNETQLSADSARWYKIIFIYNMIRTIIGIVVSIIALSGLKYNKAKLLNGLLWYFSYMMLATIFSEILVMIDPAQEEQLVKQIPYSKNSSYTYIRMRIFLSLLVYPFEIVLVFHFACVVKSCRDYMIRYPFENENFYSNIESLSNEKSVFVT